MVMHALLLPRPLFTLLFGLALFVPQAAVAQCPIPATCTPGTASNPDAQLFGMGIYRVQFGTIDNTTAGYADGYRDYSCVNGTTLVAGTGYAINVRTGQLGGERVRVWIDFDNNGALNNTTELFFASNSAANHAGTNLQIPPTATLNTPLRMRISSDATTSPTPTPCSTPEYGQVEDYAVTVRANTRPPIAAFQVRAEAGCTGVFHFTDQSLYGPTRWDWDFGDGSAHSTQQNPSHTYAAGSYQVSLRVCNAIGCDSLAQVNSVQLFAPLPVAACPVPTTAPCCGYGITRVDFAGQTQASADGSAGYEDFSCVRRFEVQQGYSYTLSLQTGPLSHAVRAWIDYDNDGSFSTAEQILDQPQGVSPSARVVIPTGGVTNTPLRMRIMADIAGAGSAFTSCRAPQFGQVEDYRVVVYSTGTCGTLLPLTPILGTFSVCPGDRSVLMLLNQQLGSALQWQTSPDSLTWTDIPGATISTCQTPAILTPAYFRVVATCGSATRATAARQVALDPMLCYCRNLSYTGNCVPRSTIGPIQRIWIYQTPLDSGPFPCSRLADSTYHLLGTNPPNQPTVLQRAATYELNVSLRDTSVKVRAWIDYDHDGAFAFEEEIGRPQSIRTGLAGTTAFTIPATAHLGPTGFRIRARPGGVSYEPCLNDADGEARDFTITIGPDTCGLPVHPGRVIGSHTYCPGSTPPLSVLYHSPGTALQWQTSPDSLIWTDIAGATSRFLRNASLRDTLYVRVRASCGATQAFSAAFPLAPNFQLCYCTAIVPATWGCRDVYLHRLRIGNTTLLSTGTNCLSGTVTTYTNYPASQPANTATLLRGISYPVYLVPHEDSPSRRTNRTMAWLDANQDGHFDDAERTELRWLQNVDSVTTMTIPPAARLGITRLRILTRPIGDDFSGRTLCQIEAEYGQEIRDYLVTIAAPPPAPSLPVVGTIRGSNAVCAGAGTRLTLSGTAYGAQFQWEQSVDNGLNWQDIPGATGTVLFTHAIPRPTTYRVKATSPSGTAYSPNFRINNAAPCPCLNLRGGRISNQIGGVAISGEGTFMMNRNDTTAFIPAGTYTYLSTLYSDYSTGSDSVYATLYPGRSYDFYVNLKYGDQSATCSVWIDYNHNGSFQASEYTELTRTGWLHRWEFGETIQIPFSITPGPMAIRVRTSSSLTLYGPDACTTLLDDGETEDYVAIVAEPPTFAAPEITLSGACGGGRVQLGTVAALPAGATVRWDGPNGFTSTAANPTLPNLAGGQSGYYLLTVEHPDLKLTAARYLDVQYCLGLPEAPATAFSLFPNPTPGRSTLRFEQVTAPLDLYVRNATGQLVQTHRLSASRSVQELELDLSHQAKGLYLIQLVGRQGTFYRKLVVE